MKLIDIDLRPDKRQLRHFGLIGLAALGVLGSLILWKGSLFGFPLGDTTGTVVGILWGAGILLGLLAAIVPGGLHPFYVALATLTYPIGYVVSHVVVALLFYGVITPIGLVFKAIGRDPLNRRMEENAESYWVDHRQPLDKSRYFRQF
jgi:hypothetical protein